MQTLVEIRHLFHVSKIGRSSCIFRQTSSKRWLDRQRRDPYAKQANTEDLRARSAFKLRDIQSKYKLIKPADYVIDLGSCPGGWALVAQEVLKQSGSGKLICIDLLPMAPIEGVTILAGDFKSEYVVSEVEQLLEGRGMANVVLSDMLHNVTGNRSTDQSRSASLVLDVLDFCEKFLRPGGSLLCKFLRGSEDNDLLEETGRVFSTVRLVKPPASRSASSEIYLLAKGHKRDNRRLVNNNDNNPIS
eukprot:gene10700-22339_t